jgi:hypothetical protein
VIAYSKKAITDVVKHIKKQSVLGRDVIDAVIADFPIPAQQLMLNFRELLYHISGARVVGCESSLPQENFIDYDLADLTQARSKLSEENILLKLFFEQAFQSLQKQPIPIELLDLLSFEDIFSIRKPLLEASFQVKYNSLMAAAIDSFSFHDHRVVLDLDELSQIHNSLVGTFRAIFEKELIPFMKRKKSMSVRALISPSLSVALGTLGTVPIVGTFAGLLSLMKDSAALGTEMASFCNIFNVSSKSISKEKLVEFEQQKASLLRRQIEISEITEKAPMFEMVDLYSRTISEKVKLVP